MNKNIQLRYEDIPTKTFVASFDKQDETVQEYWDDYYFKLLNRYLSSAHFALKFEMRQGRRNSDGFYPNYIYIVADEEQEEEINGMLEYLGFNFKKSDTKMRVFLDCYDENIGDYKVELF